MLFLAKAAIALGRPAEPTGCSHSHSKRWRCDVVSTESQTTARKTLFRQNVYFSLVYTHFARVHAHSHTLHNVIINRRYAGRKHRGLRGHVVMLCRTDKLANKNSANYVQHMPNRVCRIVVRRAHCNVIYLKRNTLLYSIV